MGALREQDVATLTATALVTTAETVIATSLPVSTRSASEQVTITGWTDITAGTGATFVTLRIRRGTGITGTLVSNATAQNVTAGNTLDYDLVVTDTPGEVAGQVYVLTAQQTAATGNGSATAASIQIGANSN